MHKKKMIFPLLFSALLLAPSAAAEESGKKLSSFSQKTRSKDPLIAQYTAEGSAMAFSLPETSLSFTQIEGKELFLVSSEEGSIVEFPFLKNDFFDQAIANRIANYNAIAANNESLPIFIYQIVNARDTSWFDESQYIEAAAPEYNRQMEEQLNPAIRFQKMDYLGWQQYCRQNYRTDHHWNVFGAYRGYTEIIAMLSEVYPQIGAPKDPQKSVCSTVQFHGSLWDGENDRFDTLCDFSYDLPKYTITVNNQPVDEYGNRSLSLDDKSGESDPAFNYYKAFFGQDSAEVIYDFGNNTGLRALIISDSYSNAIKPVLSSHFDQAVYIDLRHYLGEVGEYFDLVQAQEEYDFDLILFIGGFYTTTMDEAYHINHY